VPAAGAAAITGDALAELANRYLLAEAVIERTCHYIDTEALLAILRGVRLDLADEAAAAASAIALAVAVGSELAVETAFDATTERWTLRLERRLHGNLRRSLIDADFVASGDYALLAELAQTLSGLVGEGASVSRGDALSPIGDFRQALDWLMEQVKRNMNVQRYKGLGEMNPEQLWETTMDPTVRRLLKVQIEDAIAADEIFTTLMGDQVEPRRAFIEDNALRVSNLDV
jgi:DNA gyrase subunit B